MKRIAEGFLNLIYPRCCPLCHQVLRDQKSLACPDCLRTLHPIGQPRCRICGRPVAGQEDCCEDCAKGRVFREGRGIFLYDERMKTSVLTYKYGGRREYGAFFAAALAAFGEKDVRRWRPDLIVPVPMYKKKQRQRGFNQAEDLALQAGRLLKLPVSAGLVRKTADTKSQKKLDARSRRRNLQEAFRVTAPADGLRILVVDDVFTTGSTIEAVAAALKDAGAGEVFFLTVAIGVKKDFS